jgi:peptidyl-prolyl cis-trans isomerase B (cyclophilin B)
MLMKIPVLLLLSVLLVACTTSPQGAVVETPSEADTMNPKVEIKTNKGIITAEIFKQQAPITAGNFLSLIEQKFYDGLKFHRYVPGFVIQGGDPKGDGTGGSAKTIPLEIAKGLKHDAFYLSMARTNDPNSASSQFYITLAPTPHLDGSYAIFGKVLTGQDVVLKLREGDKMESVSII